MDKQRTGRGVIREKGGSDVQTETDRLTERKADRGNSGKQTVHPSNIEYLQGGGRGGRGASEEAEKRPVFNDLHLSGMDRGRSLCLTSSGV